MVNISSYPKRAKLRKNGEVASTQGVCVLVEQGVPLVSLVKDDTFLTGP